MKKRTFIITMSTPIANNIPIIQWSNEEKATLSQVQMNIFEEKLKGISVGTIMTNNNINRSNVYTSIEFTLLGNRWEKGKSTGGGFAYLGDIDSQILKSNIINRAIDMNCAKTIELVQLAIEFRASRRQKAKFYIGILEKHDKKSKIYRKVLDYLGSYSPSASWLTHFAEKN